MLCVEEEEIVKQNLVWFLLMCVLTAGCATSKSNISRVPAADSVVELDACATLNPEAPVGTLCLSSAGTVFERVNHLKMKGWEDKDPQGIIWFDAVKSGVTISEATDFCNSISAQLPTEDMYKAARNHGFQDIVRIPNDPKYRIFLTRSWNEENSVSCFDSANGQLDRYCLVKGNITNLRGLYEFNSFLEYEDHNGEERTYYMARCGMMKTGLDQEEPQRGKYKLKGVPYCSSIDQTSPVGVKCQTTTGALFERLDGGWKDMSSHGRIWYDQHIPGYSRFHINASRESRKPRTSPEIIKYCGKPRATLPSTDDLIFASVHGIFEVIKKLPENRVIQAYDYQRDPNYIDVFPLGGLPTDLLGGSDADSEYLTDFGRHDGIYPKHTITICIEDDTPLESEHH